MLISISFSIKHLHYSSLFSPSACYCLPEVNWTGFQEFSSFTLSSLICTAVVPFKQKTRRETIAGALVAACLGELDWGCTFWCTYCCAATFYFSLKFRFTSFPGITYLHCSGSFHQTRRETTDALVASLAQRWTGLAAPFGAPIAAPRLFFVSFCSNHCSSQPIACWENGQCLLSEQTIALQIGFGSKINSIVIVPHRNGSCHNQFQKQIHK